MFTQRLFRSLLSVATLALVSCGGGGGDPESTTPAAKSYRGSASREIGQAAVITPKTDALVGAFTPTSNAHLVGMWTPLVNWPLLAIHANVLPNGKILTFGSSLASNELPKALDFDEWDPALGFSDVAHKTVPSPTTVDAFCSATVLGADGLLLIVGGNKFWRTSQWDPDRSLLVVRAQQLHQPRWYGTIVRMPDNRVVVVGGNNISNLPAVYGDTPEIFDPASGWQLLEGAKSPETFGAFDGRWFYPRAYLAPSGKIVGVSNDLMWTLDTGGAGALTLHGSAGHRLGMTGMSVMYRPGQLLLAGGGEVTFNSEAAHKQATLIDINGDAPVVTPVSPMKFARNYANAMMLPDGKVLVTGGTGYGNSGSGAVYAAEMWDPDTGTWTQMASASEIRVYHSSAMLLPNGAVLNSGGGAPGPVHAKNAQVYFPPYFFQQMPNGQVVWAGRPAIVKLPNYLTYGGASNAAVTLADSRPIQSVALISAGAVTHSHSTNLRYVPVEFTQSGAQLTLQFSKLNDRIVPPGYYQLHVVDQQGVPSAAAIVEFRSQAGNVAKSGTATQSSRQSEAYKGKDGLLTNFTHTNSSNANPWWQLTFPEPRSISSVSLFNRHGTCSGTGDCRTRLRDVTVSVLDETGAAVWNSELLNPENELDSPDRLLVDITQQLGTAVKGKSIKVTRKSDPDLSGTAGAGGTDEKNVLSMAEVEVHGGPVNLALKKPTKQSSTQFYAWPSRAVDNNFNGGLGAGSVTHTQSSFQPWWEVDLGAVHPLSSVRVWNRIDSCCQSHLSDFYVLVSDIPFPTNMLALELTRPGVSAHHVASLNGKRAVEIAFAEGVAGRYVRVWLNGENPLSLTEVEIFGR